MEVHYESKELQKLSVRPFCTTRTKWKNTEFSFYIENPGLGPLIVERMIFTLDGVDKPIMSSHFRRFIENPQYSKYLYQNLRENFVIASNGAELLFKITAPNIQTFNTVYHPIQDMLNRMNLKIEYTDTFGTEFEPFVLFAD